jgi:hypothetical protein
MRLCDPDIWRIAAILIRKFEAEAPSYARRRGENALRQKDRVTWQVWKWIECATEELLRHEREDDDAVH